jgi:hypothetical protein
MINMTIDDFFAGLFAALVFNGRKGLSLRNENFDSSLVPVFEKLQQLAPSKGLDIQFRIRVHPFHGDSITIRGGIYSAAQHGLISLDNPEYQDIQFKFDKEQADQILENVPGGKGLFLELAKDWNLDKVTV